MCETEYGRGHDDRQVQLTSHPATSRTIECARKVEAARRILTQVSLSYQPDDSRGIVKAGKIEGDDSADRFSGLLDPLESFL